MKLLSTVLLAFVLCLGSWSVQAQNVTVYDGVIPLNTYSTLIQAYNSCTQAKNYTITLNSTYSTSEIQNGITLNAQSAAISITIKLGSSTGDRIFTRNGTNRMITFNGAKNVTIDGTSNNASPNVGMTFENGSPATNEPLFEITNGSSNIKIINCRFRSQNAGTSESGMILISNGSTVANSNITISNNIFTGNSPTNFYRVAIKSLSTSTENSNVTIQNNSFSNYRENAILASSTNNMMNNWLIDGNSFFMNNSLSILTNHEVISIGGGSGHIITGNFFGGNGVNLGDGSAGYNVVTSSIVAVNFISIGNKSSGNISILDNTFNRIFFTQSTSNTLEANLIKVLGNANFIIGSAAKPNTFGSTNSGTYEGVFFNYGNNSNVSVIKNQSTGNVTIENNLMDNINCNPNTNLTLVNHVKTTGSGTATINNNRFGNVIGIKPTSTSTAIQRLYVVYVESNTGVTIKGNTISKINNIQTEAFIFYIKNAASATITDNDISDFNIGTGFTPDIRGMEVSVTGLADISNNHLYDIFSPFTFTGISVGASQSTICKENTMGGVLIPISCSVFKGIVINSTETSTPSITVKKNEISRIQANIGTNTTVTNTMIEVMQSAVIDSNVIDNVSASYLCNAIEMKGGGTCIANQITNITTTSVSSKAINVYYDVTSNAALKIWGNQVKNNKINTPYSTSNLSAISLFFNQSCTNVTVDNNFIDLKHIDNYLLLGIVSSTNSTKTATVKVRHNTILFKSAGSNPLFNSSCILATAGVNAEVKNNIFYNEVGGSGKRYTENYSGLTGTIVTNSNYLYALVETGFGLWKNGTEYYTLSTWKTASGATMSLGGSGANGVITFSTTDEKPTGYFAGAGKGENVAILTDRFNNPRNTIAPWMGSYEGLQIQTASINPPSLCIGGTYTINFTKGGFYPTSTVFRAVLSESDGSFPATPTQIGSTNVSTATSILVTIPTTGVSAGSNYRIKVITNTAGEFTFDNGSALTISPVPVANPVTTTQSCSSNPYSIALSSSTTGTTFAWTRAAVAGVTPSTGASTTNVTTITETLISANAGTTAVTYVVTPTYNGCSGTPINITKNIVKTTMSPSQADLPQAVVGDQYPVVSFSVDPTFSNPPTTTYSIVAGSTFPSGLNYNAVTNKVTGTPSQSGNFTFTIQATDAGCVTTQTYAIYVRNLLNPNLKFTPAIVDKTYGDEPFVIPVTSRSNGALTYSIETNTSATINASTGKITLLSANPNSFIWVYVNQTKTSIYSAAKDSVRLYIRKATPKVVLTSSTSYALGQPRPLTYAFTKGYPITTPPSQPLASQDPTVAQVSIDGDSIFPIAIGAFQILFSFPELPNYSAFDSTLTFTVYEQGIPPVAVNDTVYVIRNPDNTFTVDSINIIANDTSKTGIIQLAQTDIDENNIGSQYLFFKPSIGTFVLDTLTGKLIITPYTGLTGTNYVNYYVVDEDGQVSAVAKIVIIVDDQSDTPPLQANEVMTPNGDGNNDALVIGYTDVSQPNSIMIFDVAGNTLYQSDNYQNDWLGQDKNGKSLESGIYFFVYKEKTGSQRELTGYIKITR